MKKRFGPLFVSVFAMICALFAGWNLSLQVEADEPVVEIEIPVSTVLSSTSQPLDASERIVFMIDPIGDSPLPEETTLTLRPSQQSTFGPIDISQPGTYRYIIHPSLLENSSVSFVDDSDLIVQVEAYRKADGTLETQIEGYPDEASARSHTGKKDLVWMIESGMPKTEQTERTPGEPIIIEKSPAPFSAISLIVLACIALIVMQMMRKNK